VSGLVEAGPFVAWLPDGWVDPRHEHQAIGLTRAGTTAPMLTCSRAEWAEFVKAIKSGKLDA
jgi:hypothetical protein